MWPEKISDFHGTRKGRFSCGERPESQLQRFLDICRLDWCVFRPNNSRYSVLTLITYHSLSIEDSVYEELTELLDSLL